MLTSRALQFGGHPSLHDCLPRQPPEPHEIKTRHRIAFDEFEGKEDHHANEPGQLEEVPSTVIGDNQPSAGGKKNQSPRYNESIIEHGDVTNGLGEKSQIPQLSRAEVGNEYADKSPG